MGLMGMCLHGIGLRNYCKLERKSAQDLKKAGYKAKLCQPSSKYPLLCRRIHANTILMFVGVPNAVPWQQTGTPKKKKRKKGKKKRKPRKKKQETVSHVPSYPSHPSSSCYPPVVIVNRPAHRDLLSDCYSGSWEPRWHWTACSWTRRLAPRPWQVMVPGCRRSPASEFQLAPT